MITLGELPKTAKIEVLLTFDDSELEGVKFSHDDSLMITPVIEETHLSKEFLLIIKLL